MRDPGSHPQLRASDADREAAVERLQVATMEGRLSADELDERLSGVYAARLCSELQALLDDVTPATLAATPSDAPDTPPAFVHRMRDVNAFALASVFCSLIWLLGSPLAVIFGHVALRQIARSEGRQGGRNIAITGLVLGYGGLLLMLVALGGLSAGDVGSEVTWSRPLSGGRDAE